MTGLLFFCTSKPEKALLGWVIPKYMALCYAQTCKLSDPYIMGHKDIEYML